MTMRYLMKGGYWKNSEDEILKAAIMKYGLNQWARIASLMSRKSVKQCKARWYEWLDPSIKKTEWTREEEERLLHLAKLFPAQWRTIAPMLNRTPQMCIEHYERLLDMTLDRKYDDENDPRKLLPGEIDALAEHRPARADPVDMDDDEREMIAETKVRIANKKGKKEKRKARERTLEEARRLATIQKFRELRNAGVDFVIERKQKKKVKTFSYGSEVPMERLPVEAGHEVSAEERARANKNDLNIANISIAELEGQRREESDAKRRQQDLDKIKKLRSQNVPGKMLKNRVNDPTEIYGREGLLLEEPQLKDNEIEEICKLKKRSGSQFRRQNPPESSSSGQRGAANGAEASEFRCTDVLLTDADVDTFDNLVNRIRTPRAMLGIMQQAREIAVINDPKASFDTSTIMENKSISMAPSLAKSRISTPNPLKQYIQDIQKSRDGQSRVRRDSDSVSQSQYRGGLFNRLGPSDAGSVSDLPVGGLGRFGSHVGPTDFGRPAQALPDPAPDTGLTLAQIELSDKQFRAERTAYLKSIFKGLPPPTNAFIIDYDDLKQQYDEATGANNPATQAEEDPVAVLAPPLAPALLNELREGIQEQAEQNQEYIERMTAEELEVFLDLCDRLKVTTGPRRDEGPTSDASVAAWAVIDREVTGLVTEVIRAQPDGFLDDLATKILGDCEAYIWDSSE